VSETYRLLGAEREAELLAEAERLHRLPSSRWRSRLAAARSTARRLSIRRRRGAARLKTSADEKTIMPS
jgi:hypothetical protein